MSEQLKKLAHEWFDQAESELKGAKVLFENSIFEQACFNCHQAVEFALKGFIILEKGESELGHNLRVLARKVGSPPEIEKKSTYLNSAYQDARYVDKNEEAPAKIYTFDKAKQHIEFAEEVIEWIKKKLSKK
jgi:HEPN domain-containing protein